MRSFFRTVDPVVLLLMFCVFTPALIAALAALVSVIP